MIDEGITITTAVLAAAPSYDLTDLGTTKDELQIKASDSANDTWIARAISQVSKAIMNNTRRVFAPEYVQDLFDIRRVRYQVPNGSRELQLSRWPVLSIASVVVNLVGEDTTLVLVENTDFRVDYPTGTLYRLDPDTNAVSAWEAMPVTVQYSAGFGAAVQESHTVPGTSFKITVAGASTFSCDQTVSYANGTLLTPVATSPSVGEYTVATGVYLFALADVGQVLSFAYCTGEMPYDLVDATLQLITARFSARGRDPALIQRDTPGIGTERFWFGGSPGQTGPFPPDIQGILDSYRPPMVA